MCGVQRGRWFERMADVGFAARAVGNVSCFVS